MNIIRCKTFETNSSSSHSIVIDLLDNQTIMDLKFPINIEPWWNGEFGWEWDTWCLPDEKIAYVIRCAESGIPWDDEYDIPCSADYETIMGVIQKRFNDIGIYFEIPDKQTYLINGYVEHGNDYWFSDIKEIYEDDTQLLKFIFNNNSYIKGGNDNDMY